MRKNLIVALVVAVILALCTGVVWFVRHYPAALGGAGVQQPPDTRVLGEITAVGQGSITVTVVEYKDSVTPTKVGSRTFDISTSTHITTQVLRPRAEFEAELAAYKAGKGPATKPYTDKILALSDLKVGMQVTITPAGAPDTAGEILVIR